MFTHPVHHEQWSQTQAGPGKYIYLVEVKLVEKRVTAIHLRYIVNVDIEHMQDMINLPDK